MTEQDATTGDEMTIYADRLLSAVQMFASAIEELSKRGADVEGAVYWAASGLQQVLAMIPRDDLLPTELALVEALEKHGNDEAVTERL